MTGRPETGDLAIDAQNRDLSDDLLQIMGLYGFRKRPANRLGGGRGHPPLQRRGGERIAIAEFGAFNNQKITIGNDYLPLGPKKMGLLRPAEDRIGLCRGEVA